jgi:hypothetical protein
MPARGDIAVPNNALDEVKERGVSAACAQFRSTGGPFSSDDVHPTTVCDGILAQETISVMRTAESCSRTPLHSPALARSNVDYVHDSLVRQPPQNVTLPSTIRRWAKGCSIGPSARCVVACSRNTFQGESNVV